MTTQEKQLQLLLVVNNDITGIAYWTGKTIQRACYEIC